jgi:mannose-6-phosphate isomerase-like protein (cupin superfamily)
MKFTLEMAWHWSIPGGIEGWSYGSKEVSPAASASVVHVDGRHGKSKSTVSDRVVYILEGEGEYVVGDEAVRVRPTDVIVIPKNAAFDCSGKMKYLVVHVPAYDHDHEVSLE